MQVSCQLKYFTLYFSFTKNSTVSLLDHLNLGHQVNAFNRQGLNLNIAYIICNLSKPCLLENKFYENPDIMITLMNSFIPFECCS